MLRVPLLKTCAFLLGLLLLVSMPVLAATLQVYPGNTQGWTFGTFGTPPSAAFVNGPGTPPIGTGSYSVTITTNNSKALLNPPVVGITVGGLLPFTYSTIRTTGVASQWYINMYVDTNADTVCDARLTYSPSSAAANVWETWDAGAATTWSAKTVGGCFGSPDNLSNQSLATFAGGTVMGLVFNIGDTGVGYIGYNGALDNVTIAGNTYDFELSPSASGGGASGTGGGVIKEPPFEFKDGRINRRDTAAPIAIYAVNYGGQPGIHVYRIRKEDNSRGELLLKISGEEVAAVPERPETNVAFAITADKLIGVYRLATGEIQVNASMDNGKLYILRFRVISSGADYESLEEIPTAQ